MPVVPLKHIIDRAFDARYGVAAINVVNDLTLEAVLAAAVEQRAPLIVQTSVKTVKSIGSRVLSSMWKSMTSGIEVPVSLHLDHCPDRTVISECLKEGWNSVLFDASTLPIEENRRQTAEVVIEARSYGANVEGEIESITGVEDGHGSNNVAQQVPLDAVVKFIEETGVEVFAPAIGNAHGTYGETPQLDGARVSDIVAATDVPIALHGGTGLSEEQFTDLISRGCAKVNISTALKISYMRANLDFLRQAEREDVWDPPSLFTHTASAVRKMAADHMVRFGSKGMAW